SHGHPDARAERRRATRGPPNRRHALSRHALRRNRPSPAQVVRRSTSRRRPWRLLPKRPLPRPPDAHPALTAHHLATTVGGSDLVSPCSSSTFTGSDAEPGDAVFTPAERRSTRGTICSVRSDRTISGGPETRISTSVGSAVARGAPTTRTGTLTNTRSSV